MDERQVTLGALIEKPGQKLRYEYDFGDSWEHELTLEKILLPSPGALFPVLLDGERACPPEDVGGVWGYEELLDALADPGHPRHEEFLEWMGERFDPERYDPSEANLHLHGGWVQREPKD